MTTIQVQMRHRLGHFVSVSVARKEDVADTLREYGADGYTGEIPPGGLQLPYADHDTFDWSLIGARAYTTPEGEIVVAHRNMYYKQRKFEAVESKKKTLPAAIKYSRGARPTDPPEIVEKGDGDISYVTLILFRGKGRATPEYARKD